MATTAVKQPREKVRPGLARHEDRRRHSAPFVFRAKVNYQKAQSQVLDRNGIPLN